MEGKKNDEGKLRFSLLPMNAIREIIKVLECGAKKYEEDNWKRVPDRQNRYFDAAMRHLTTWFDTAKIDPEWGLNHLAHAGCCILFLLYEDLKNMELDKGNLPPELREDV